MNRVEDFINAAKTNEMLGELLHIKNEEEIRNFIEKNKRAHFLQSPEWAKVNTDWEN